MTLYSSFNLFFFSFAAAQILKWADSLNCMMTILLTKTGNFQTKFLFNIIKFMLTTYVNVINYVNNNNDSFVNNELMLKIFIKILTELFKSVYKT